MFIKIKRIEKYIKVDVSEKSCEFKSCFSPHKYQHRSYNGAEGSMTNSDEHYSCSHRNYHGCPTENNLKAERICK